MSEGANRQAAPEPSNRVLTLTLMCNSTVCVSKGPGKRQEALQLGLDVCYFFCQLVSIFFQPVMLTARE